ncbi:MAG: sigma-70 family RNA polymerase sigma factor [Chloroflexi bacterium]|nr:sigma-70 family RNA polymerase sigma factor [Chloroflexota bacterium]MCY3717721.1 sigma-70 family RNA polymerase sigma factor [Chloroflexota bacterium]MXX84254.1 sigma-70 family RNA polymerase sigma factor [Chloroflexota bacterium]MYC54179.1 sigma-70 family RNA polymerase sigma factor [Chloroflexota bacterium]MYH66353.1 sigma-70 family RNA polymerase sigma factor [Chloroflexota bacterium]
MYDTESAINSGRHGNMTGYKDWVRQAQAGGRADKNQAFDRLVRDYRGMVYGIAYTRTSDTQLAEDIAQEAFLTAYTRISQLKDTAAFPAWLRRIALTQADRLNRAQPNEKLDESSLADPAASPEAQVEMQELRARVRAAVAALPAAQRTVTSDFYFEGQSQREISERLGLPLATVKKRLQYARAHLRGLLAGINEGIDRAFTADQPTELQPVYIYQRRRKTNRSPSSPPPHSPR